MCICPRSAARPSGSESSLSTPPICGVVVLVNLWTLTCRLTNTATSAARLYWENRNENLISAAAQKTDQITLPVAITAFSNDDLYRPPETWARRAFPNLIYFNEAEAGGHFPAWEVTDVFATEVRAAFRSLR